MSGTAKENIINHVFLPKQCATNNTVCGTFVLFCVYVSYMGGGGQNDIVTKANLHSHTSFSAKG